MVPGRPSLGRILLEKGIVSNKQLDQAIQHQITRGNRLGEALVELGLCSDIDIARALADQLEIPFVNLQETPPLPSFVALIPRELALEHGVLPVRMDKDRLLVAARDPFDIRADEVVRQATGMRVVLASAPDAQLKELLQQYYSLNQYDEPTRDGEHREVQTDDGEHDETQSVSMDQIVAAGEQVSTVRMVNALIADAIRRGASDVHIEPEENRVRVRYRLDGRMRTVVTIQRSLLQSVVARIKILSGMDISENRKPQDGGTRVKVDGRPIELRISTLPGIYGEIVVIRVLNHDPALQKMDMLGLEADMLMDLRRLLAARQGMVLITGPTGSGKTTSLYAALGHLNTEEVNIITVEDPVEIKLRGVNQVQINERAGRSFSSTLRAMLRQDPDIVMLGEIRDLETAEIACRAALTGHLVLSTLHTLDTLGTLSRLFDMGVAPYIVTAALNGVLAQRLVRKVCDNCSEPYDPPVGLLGALQSQFGSIEGATFRKGAGCGQCNKTGTRGRIGAYELLAVDEDMRHRLAEDPSPSAIRDFLRSRGHRTMEEDAFRKAFRGLIAPEEVVNLGMGLAMKMEELSGPIGVVGPGAGGNGNGRPALPASASRAPQAVTAGQTA
jgi:type IV pilus assembly protein PilB